MSHDWERELSIVIPAYNEEDGIGPTLADLRASLPHAEVIVVDDGSSDATAERAGAVEGVRLVRHAFNRGYGAALKTGMRRATRRFIAWFDADNEHRIEDLSQMADRMYSGKLAAVIGRRLHPGRSLIRTWGKWVIRMSSRSLGVDVGKDLNCGLRVFRRSVIRRYLDLLPDQFSASLTSTMILVQRGYPLAFHDIEVKPRIGESKVRISHGFSTLALVLRTVMLFAPMRIFGRTGLALLFVGGGYGLPVAITTGRGLPVAALLVILVGLVLTMVGLVADQISQLRLVQLARRDDADDEEE